MKQYLESQRGWLQVETLPGYSPRPESVEDLWSNIKGQELANRCVAGLGEAKRRVERYESSAQIHAAIFFPAHAGLFFGSVLSLYCAGFSKSESLHVLLNERRLQDVSIPAIAQTANICTQLTVSGVC